MSLARIVFEKRKLEARYGVAGRVAGLYLEAGYSVAMNFPTPNGRLSFVAKKGGETLAVDVVAGSVKVGPDVVESLVSKALSIKARPVLVLYGSGPTLAEEAKAKISEAGVKVRRVRLG